LKNGIPKISDFGDAKTKGTINPHFKTKIGTFQWMAPGS
jgi:serine/threonine protein kinase